MSGMTATYSPEDNKLRLYSVARLDSDTYKRVRAAGFIYAPKQELFVAPMWTPEREDLLLELCGEIGDEDTTLTDRAEQRAERFETYSEKREADANAAHAAVERITSGIPLGQPILVGHHSERHARKDAERIDNGMRKAVRMWETSKYWTDRAEGAIAHAKYKELPAVRHRRIKTIEAEKRKCERSKAEAEQLLRVWTTEGLTLEMALRIAGGRCNLTVARGEDGQRWSAYDVLRPDEERYRACPAWTVEQVQAAAREAYPRTVAHCDRWIQHCENRLTYERAMLAASGWTPPPKPKSKAELPILNYAGNVSTRNRWHPGQIDTAEAQPITKAELSKIHTDYKGTRISACGTHRVRVAMLPGRGHALHVVYLSDSKQHQRPTAEAIEAKAGEESAAADRLAEEQLKRQLSSREESLIWKHHEERTEDQGEADAERAETDAKGEKFRALRESLKGGGVQVVSAPQLFPTPPELAARMVELAEIDERKDGPQFRILEPSAGTGNILWEIARRHSLEVLAVDAVEINRQLADNLRRAFPNVRTYCADFLTFDPEKYPPYDAILMNPPFGNAADIQHIEHARKFLKPGGRLVAICANGPRQREALQPIADEWIDLPPDTFKSSGTNVNTALLVINAPAETNVNTPVEVPTSTKPTTQDSGPMQRSLF